MHLPPCDLLKDRGQFPRDLVKVTDSKRENESVHSFLSHDLKSTNQVLLIPLAKKVNDEALFKGRENKMSFLPGTNCQVTYFRSLAGGKERELFANSSPQHGKILYRNNFLTVTG